MLHFITELSYVPCAKGIIGGNRHHLLNISLQNANLQTYQDMPGQHSKMLLEGRSVACNFPQNQHYSVDSKSLQEAGLYLGKGFRG